MRVSAVRDLLVGFDDVCLGEFVRMDTTCSRDEELGGRFELVAAREGEISGAEYRGQVRTRAVCFGWASSFCCASNWKAARWLENDLRLREPDLSRQSA